MAASGTVVIHHQDGRCEYKVKSVAINFFNGRLNLELETETVQECPLDGLGAPNLYIDLAEVHASSVADLQHEELRVARGWDDEHGSKDDDVFRIYMSAHFALDDNEVVIERTGRNAFRLKWTAESDDLSYYDERAKRNRIEVHAEFQA